MCKKCNGKSEVQVENLYDHIQAPKHRKITPENEIEKLDQLIFFINTKEDRKKKSTKETKILKDTKDYLGFLAFCLAKSFLFAKYLR